MSAFVRNLRRLKLPPNPKVRVGIAIFVFFALLALLGPFVVQNVMGLSPSDVDTAQAMELPSAKHLLGTTATGEDVFAQLVVGSRISLLVGLVAGVITTTLSVLVGVAGGYLGGRADSFLTAATNVCLVIPGMPLLIIVASYVQGRGGWLTVALVIGLTAWPWGARQKRAQTLSLRHRDFVSAAEMTGESRWGVITRELIPSLAPIISVSFLGAVVGSMFADSRPLLHGARQHQHHELGLDALLGAERSRPDPGRLVVVRATGRVHRPDRRRRGPDQLRN